MTEFEPKIVAFLCNWCAYGGADLAGVSRMQYPSNTRTVRVMCSGRVDPLFLVRALKEGADGILVSGWHFGDCHYLEGNVQAEKKIRMTQKLFALAGFGEDRLHLEWVSSAEAGRFVEVISATVEAVRQAGRFDAGAAKMALDAAESTLSGEIVRWIVGKEVRTTTKGDVYGRKWDVDTFDMIIDSVLEREYQKNLILQAIKAGHTSPRAIHAAIGLELQRISYLIADMEKTNMVEFRGMTDRIPEFAAL